jgi:hypothetical protein
VTYLGGPYRRRQPQPSDIESALTTRMRIEVDLSFADPQSLWCWCSLRRALQPLGIESAAAAASLVFVKGKRIERAPRVAAFSNFLRADQ